jgi:hypothetical protein
MTIQTSNIHSRVRSIIAVALELGYDFLNKSKLNSATKLLVNQGAKRLVDIVANQVDYMPEADIRKQLLYVRDEVIPYLLGDMEVANDNTADKDTG